MAQQRRGQGQHRPAANTNTNGLSEYASRLLSHSTRLPGVLALAQSGPSTAPLFHSAHEGRTDDDDDENDYADQGDGGGRAQQRVARTQGWFSRGAPVAGDEDDEGVLPPPPGQEGYAVPDQGPYYDEVDYDDPFRHQLAPSEASPPPPRHLLPSSDGTSAGSSRYPLPPRHVMASQALAAMMAEAAGADDGDGTDDDDQVGPELRRSRGEGWRMYTSKAPPPPEAPYRDEPVSPARGEVVLPHVSHSLAEPPSHPHPLLRARPPEVGAPSTKEVKAPLDRRRPETVYVYPSQARDVGRRTGSAAGWNGSDDVSEEDNGPAGRTEKGPRYRDAQWLVAYLGAVGWCCYEAVSLALAQPPPSTSPSTPPPSSPSTLLSTLPLLIILATLALAVGCTAIGYLLFVQRGGVRHLVRAFLIGSPLALVLFSGWAWAASFTSSASSSPSTPSDHRGLFLRIVALVAFFGALILARAAWEGRKRVERTVRVLELCGTVVVAHPPLVVACLFLGLVFTLCAIPFLSLLYRLVSLPPASTSHSLLVLKACSVGFVYAWTLATLRSVQRLLVSGVVASWYFSRHDPSHPPPLELVVASLTRATGPSLGTAVQAGFWVASLDLVAFTLRRVRSLTRKASEIGNGRTGTLGFPWNVGWWIVHPILAAVAPLVSFACALVAEVVGGYAVVYAGVTGVGFAESARRVGGLLVRNGTVGLADNLLVKLLLTLTSLTVAFATFLISLWLIPYVLPPSSPSTDPSSSSSSVVFPLVAVCSGLVPFWTVRFVGDVVANAADTLFCCWNVDLELGVNHSAKAQEAFGEPIASTRRRRQQQHGEEDDNDDDDQV